jgi:hypothetical protein
MCQPVGGRETIRPYRNCSDLVHSATLDVAEAKEVLKRQLRYEINCSSLNFLVVAAAYCLPCRMVAVVIRAGFPVTPCA